MHGQARRRGCERSGRRSTVGSLMGSTGSAQTANTGRFFIALKPRDRAHRHGVGHHQSAAPAARQGRRREPRAPGLAGHHRRRPHRPRRSINSRCRTPISPSSMTGRRRFSPSFRRCPSSPTSRATCRTTRRSSPSASIAIRQRASAFCPQVIDATLNDAFGQRQVAQYYTQTDTYTVVLEVPPSMQGNLATLDNIYLKSPLNGQPVPLSTLVTTDNLKVGPLSVSHQGQFPAVTISFNLRQGRGARAGDRCDPEGGRRHGQAGLADRHLPGQRPGISDLARQRADPDRRGAHRHLCHPRHAL